MRRCCLLSFCLHPSIFASHHCRQTQALERSGYKNTIHLNFDLSRSLSISFLLFLLLNQAHFHPITHSRPPFIFLVLQWLNSTSCRSPISLVLLFILLRSDIIFAIRQLDYFHLSETPEADYSRLCFLGWGGKSGADLCGLIWDCAVV